MATKVLNYTAAEINQRLNLAGTAVQPNALDSYYTKLEVDGKVVVDLSARYSASYANLSAALIALDSDATATNIKKGGVSIKFINSTTNKYEQWNLKASSWSTNTSDWALDVDANVVSNKLKLPFELEKPSSNEYVTQASEIGYGGIPAACGLIYDISVAHAVNNVPAQYKSLSAALGTNGANIPQDVRRGGMSIKFIQSSDNKYVQYRLMADAWSIKVADWQGVDVTPTFLSRNIVESGGVWKAESLCIVGNTINLLSPNSNTHTLMSDAGETGSVSDNYVSFGPISVIPGHSYRLYKKNMTTSFGNLNAKVYDNGSLIQKSNESQVIEIPLNLTSPRVYLTNYKDASAAYNFSECMFVDITSNGVPTEFHPFYRAYGVDELKQSLTTLDNKFTEANRLWGFLSVYSGTPIIEIDTTNGIITTKVGRGYITSKYYVPDEAHVTSLSINIETDATAEFSGDLSALWYLVFDVTSTKFLMLRASGIYDLRNNSLIILGLGSLARNGESFMFFGTSIKIDGRTYTRNPKAIQQTLDTIVPIVNELNIVAVKREIVRTDNLFNYQSPDIIVGFYNDSHVYNSSTNFNSFNIPVEAGKTYVKYENTSVSAWGSTALRVFDNDVMIAKGTSSVEVPQDAVNPIAQLSFYSESSPNYHDTSKFMVLESTVEVTRFLPYYDTIYDESLHDYIVELINESGVTIDLVQTTGSSTTDAMSQAAITIAIANAVEGLASISCAQATGSSTTQPMSQKAITDAIAELAEAITGTPQYRFAERPASGYENFLVNVDCSIADDVTISDAVQDARDIKQDRCILCLPVNYSRSGEPVRLVFCGHGTGWLCTEDKTSPWGGVNVNLLLAEGYAVLGCNGTPGELNGLASGHNCVPECYRSVLAAYKYVIEKYNIKRDGILTTGLSMGTYMTAQIACFGDIPVLAQVFYSFSGEIWKAQYTLKSAVRQRMCEKFGFTGTAPTFSGSNPPSAAEQQYIKDNLDKWAGYNPLLAGLTNKAILSTYNVWLASNVISNADEAAIYDDAIIVKRPPCKFFVCDDDTTAPKRWSEYMVKMIRNGGGYAELRHYATGGHNSWGAGSNITVNTKYGGSMTVKGSSYEGLLFLQRFDK